MPKPDIPITKDNRLLSQGLYYAGVLNAQLWQNGTLINCRIIHKNCNPTIEVGKFQALIGNRVRVCTETGPTYQEIVRCQECPIFRKYVSTPDINNN